MEKLYDKHEEFNIKLDELNTQMLSNPDESIPLHKLLQKIKEPIGEAVYEGKLPKKKTYTIDLGHGLYSPFDSYSFLTWNFDTIFNEGNTKPLNLNMIKIQKNGIKE